MVTSFYVLRSYCRNYENIENFDKAVNDTTQIWECHHRLELEKTGGVCDVTKQDLIDWGIYYDRPADELIFLTKAEHRKLHHTGKEVSNRGKCWFTNGKVNVMASECPEGFWKGMTRGLKDE